MTPNQDDSKNQSGYSMRGVQGRLIEGLGRAIVGGRHEVGKVLPREAELMEEYSASRTSLREAMKVLSAKGLIEIRQKSGTRVRDSSMWNTFDTDILTWYTKEGKAEAIIHDLIELRQLLEPSAARLAATRGSMSDLKRIDRAHRSMVENVAEPTRYAESDVEFHMAVFSASHNVFLMRFGLLVAELLKLSFELQQRALVDRENVRDFSKDVERHRLAYDCIHRSDPEAAAAAMLETVLDGKKDLMDAIDSLREQDSAEKY